jgi:hypothetical protein
MKGRSEPPEGLGEAIDGTHHPVVARQVSAEDAIELSPSVRRHPMAEARIEVESGARATAAVR